MSGAGKTVAIQAFEDLGYFCVDNMPPNLLPKFCDLLQSTGKITKVALVVDLRSRAFYDDVFSMIVELDNDNQANSQILFLDATNEELVSRYKETRRSHPLAMEGRLMDGITKERALLNDMKNRAQLVIDTSTLSPRQLRERIFSMFKEDQQATFNIEVLSFGFKYGLPIDADNVIDVRFLPNPYYVPELRRHTGLDADVSEYVMAQPLTEDFYQKWLAVMTTALPGYVAEGKTMLTIAVGCTGGQHRSVALAQRLGEDLKQRYPQYQVGIIHRDIAKHKETVNRS